MEMQYFKEYSPAQRRAVFILSVTIHRQGFSFQDILYNKRNQFFRKMIRTIIIGTTGNAYRHFISIEIRFYK